jgi:hypothetical protein
MHAFQDSSFCNNTFGSLFNSANMKHLPLTYMEYLRVSNSPLDIVSPSPWWGGEEAVQYWLYTVMVELYS